MDDEVDGRAIIKFCCWAVSLIFVAVSADRVVEALNRIATALEVLAP